MKFLEASEKEINFAIALNGLNDKELLKQYRSRCGSHGLAKAGQACGTVEEYDEELEIVERIILSRFKK